jgi:hypothetical protein
LAADLASPQGKSQEQPDGVVNEMEPKTTPRPPEIKPVSLVAEGLAAASSLFANVTKAGVHAN